MLKYFFTNDQPSHVDIEIDAVMRKMETVGPTDDTYPKLLSYLERLEKIKASNRPVKASRDAWVNAGASILGIIAIALIEDRRVWTSAARAHIIRPKGT